jgi:phosphoglycerate-specific signal transduction histidine kinase
MKISHRLGALSALSGLSLALVAGVSWYAVTSIQSDLQGLTARAGPLQTKTYELQERTERLMGGLLRLSLVHNPDDAAKAGAVLAQDIQAVERLRGEIAVLDPKAPRDGVDFKAAQAEIGAAVDRRLADDAA